MEDFQRVLRSFSEWRDKQPDIQEAIDEVCRDTELAREEVLAILEVTGVYVLPGSEMENSIKSFISQIDKDKIVVNDLIREIGFRFCISTKESRRLVESFANS